MVLSGISSLEQLLDNTSYRQDSEPFFAGEQEAVTEAVKVVRLPIAIPCTACRYWMTGCLKGMAILSETSGRQV